MAELNNNSMNVGNNFLEVSKEQMMNHPNSKGTLEQINLAIADVKRNVENLFENVNVAFRVSFTNKIDEPMVNAMKFDLDNVSGKQNVQVSANFNFMKLCSLPKYEVYMAVYHTLSDPIMKKKEAVANSGKVLFGREEELLKEREYADNDQNFDRQGNYVKPKNIIIEYIKAFLRKLFGIEKFDESALEQHTAIYSGKLSSDYENSARDIFKNFVEQGVTPLDMFDNPPDLSQPAPANANGQTYDNSQMTALFASRYGQVVKQDNQQQATYLLGVFSQDEFNALKSGNDEQIKAFCEKFAKKFLGNCGLAEGTYSITYDKFDSKGNVRAAGSYIDYGANGQVININIEQVKSIKNPAEVVMILAHELTHAVDSAANKGQGKFTEQGFGLLNNTIGGTSGLGVVQQNESAEVYDFVKHLTEICYRLNPNERSAREGELIALEFMMGMNPDPTMKAYIEKSINSYKSYQDKVLANFAELDGLEAQLKAIESQIRSPETRNIIKARMDYLKKLKQENLLNVSGVERSVDQALDIKAELSSDAPLMGE